MIVHCRINNLAPLVRVSVADGDQLCQLVNRLEIDCAAMSDFVPKNEHQQFLPVTMKYGVSIC